MSSYNKLKIPQHIQKLLPYRIHPWIYFSILGWDIETKSIFDVYFYPMLPCAFVFNLLYWSSYKVINLLTREVVYQNRHYQLPRIRSVFSLTVLSHIISLQSKWYSKMTCIRDIRTERLNYYSGIDCLFCIYN